MGLLGSAVEASQDKEDVAPGTTSFADNSNPMGFDGEGGEENTDAYADDRGLSNPLAVPIDLTLK